MFHTADVLVLNYSMQVSPALDSMDTQPKQKVVKRGIQDQAIDEGESEEIDHLLFMVHGIGAGCDLKFRSVEEVGKFTLKFIYDDEIFISLKFQFTILGVSPYNW